MQAVLLALSGIAYGKACRPVRTKARCCSGEDKARFRAHQCTQSRAPMHAVARTKLQAAEG